MANTGDLKMRLMSAIVALVAMISLAARWVISADLLAGADPLWVAWRMLIDFGVLANIAAVVILLRAALRGRVRVRRAAAITVVMILTGLLYHTVSPGIVPPVGLAWWADQGLHTIVPVLTLLWWLAFAPKAGLTAFDSLRWLIWPILYADYILVRGLATGSYPYLFLDVTTQGIGQVIWNIGALAGASLTVGLLLIGLARVIR